MYALLRAIAGIALRWFYRGIDVEGLDRIPRGTPIILVVNHPNALVDALVIGWVIPRRVIITAKATLFQNPMFAWFLARAGVVPLVRASDVRSGAVSGPSDASRNERSFQALRSVLERGGAMLIFPEGISHDQPALAPLRTGAARIALQARDEAGVRGLHIVPVGLTFERKDAPRSRVLAQVGEPIAMDAWHAPAGAANDAQALTDEIDARLRAVTLNYASVDDASRSAALASLFASVLADEPRALGEIPPLGFEVGLARRVDDARALLAQRADDALRARADTLLKRLAEFEQTLARHGVALDDVSVSTSIGDGARFLAREGWIIALAGPLALWGFVNHWIPFHAARAIAVRSIESAADPAMRTIVAGAALVLAFYAAQGALVAALAGKLAAFLYLVSLPLAADANFALRERLARGTRRARAYLLFRRRPRLQARLQEELRHLRAEALELDGLLREDRRAQQPV
jgi:1-acyl-sn-glycerol-3-phosphate acyltransferase